MDEIEGKVVYISGPYRSDTTLGVTANIIRAGEAAERLRSKGAFVFCPHMNSAHGNLGEKVYLREGLELLARSDAIYMLHGWELSKGSQAELNLAKDLELRVIYE